VHPVLKHYHQSGCTDLLKHSHVLLLLHIWIIPKSKYYGKALSCVRTGPTWDRLIIWCPFKLIFFELFFGLGKGWKTVLRVCAQVADNFHRNSFTFGNHISDYSIGIIPPLIGWHPGSCLAGMSVSLALYTNEWASNSHQCVRFVKIQDQVNNKYVLTFVAGCHCCLQSCQVLILYNASCVPSSAGTDFL
jgi:hypothetical protein